MKLFFLKNPDADLGRYFSCVVCAKNETAAKEIDPNPEPQYRCPGEWTSPDRAICKYIGEAATDIEEGSVIDSNYAT